MTVSYEETHGLAVSVTGAFRIWLEHPPTGTAVQTEADRVPWYSNSNPDHQVELHPEPIGRISGRHRLEPRIAVVLRAYDEGRLDDMIAALEGAIFRDEDARRDTFVGPGTLELRIRGRAADLRGPSDPGRTVGEVGGAGYAPDAPRGRDDVGSTSMSRLIVEQFAPTGNVLPVAPQSK